MNHIKIYMLSALLTLGPQMAMAQQAKSKDKPKTERKHYATRKVSGKVIEGTTGRPVAGALVSATGVKGYGAITDDQGCYQMDVPTIVTNITVKSPDHQMLSVGLAAGEMQNLLKLWPQSFSADYGKDNNVIAASSTDDLNHVTATMNVKDEIQKHLGAYAYTTAHSGMPGIGSTMFIQGLNSLNASAQPLVVVDGVILEQQYNREYIHDGFFNDILSGINPADIENVTVMRNATALYGAKGANGVILITTKRAKSLATRITATISAGVTFLPKRLPVMDADGYRNYASEMLKTVNTGITDFKFLNPDPNYYYYPMYHNNTDWGKDLYHTALTQNYGVNVSGGDTEASYNLSVGYTSADATLKCNNMHRLNVRFNTDIHLGQKLDVRFDASFSNTTRAIRDDGAPKDYVEGTPTAPAFLGYVKAPFLSKYSFGAGQLSKDYFDITDESYLNETLALYSNYNYKLANPYAINEYAESEYKNRFENSLLNITIQPVWNFNSHLKLSELFSWTLVNTNEKYYIPVNGVPDYYVSSVKDFRENEARSLFSKQNSLQSDTRLTWSNRYDEHAVSAFGGIRLNSENYSRNTQLGYNTGSDKTPFITSALLNATAKGTKEEWNNAAIYLQANYGYRDRYFLQANITTEGSSLFGKDAGSFQLGNVGWGIFPSVQAAWVMSNEEWLAKVPFVNYLKLTAGYDVSGNDDIYQFAARSYFAPVQFMNDISGIYLAGIGNTKIQWETTNRANIGLEMHLFDNRVGMKANVFTSRTNNLLMLQQLRSISGIESNWANGGKLKNSGFDISLTGKVLATKAWQWEIGASAGHYKNEIIELADGKAYIDNDLYGATIRTAVGKAANLFYGYKTNGVFATHAEAQEAGLYTVDEIGNKRFFSAGDMHFVDTDGNHEINEDDRVVIGDPNPDLYGNIFTSVQYRRLRLDVNMNYSLGNDIYNYMRSQLESGSRFMNQTIAMEKRWQVEGDKTMIPKLTFQDPIGNSRFSDRWIEDGSYLRLKTVTLSYQVPLKVSFIQGMEVWLQGNNLLTLTKYLGADPEVNAFNSVIGQGIDTGCLPLSRNVMIGTRINF